MNFFVLDSATILYLATKFNSMSKSTLVLFFLLSLSTLTNAQTHDFYTASAGEMIFSLGNVDAGQDQLDAVLRWSPFFNLEQQLHFDFSKAFGMYTGLGLHNIGLISHTTEGYKIKECSYSLGIPVMFKLGNMDKNTSINIGAEAEMVFTYKQKIFVGDTKTKNSAWFSDNVNIFNPSGVIEVKFAKGQYIRFKYYFDDFLNYQPGGLTIPTPTLTEKTKELPEYGISSPLFYVSLGSVFIRKPLDSDKSTGTQKAYRNNDGFFSTASSKN